MSYVGFCFQTPWRGSWLVARRERRAVVQSPVRVALRGTETQPLPARPSSDPAHQTRHIATHWQFLFPLLLGWLGSRVVSVLDSGAEGPGWNRSRNLRQTVHTHCASVHQAAKLVAALLRVAGITAGLAESNGSIPPSLWLTSPASWLPRNGISSGTLRSVIEYGLPLPFYCNREVNKVANNSMIGA